MKNKFLISFVIGASIIFISSPITTLASTSSMTLAQATTDTFVPVNIPIGIPSDLLAPFKKIDNTIYECAVEYKDSIPYEEGFSTVYIKNTKNNTYKAFKFKSAQPNAQITALKVACGSGDTLYIITGSAFGTLSYGGSVYSLDVNTCKTKLVAPPFNSSEQIVDAKLDGNKLNLTCYLFDDEALNYITYTRSVNL